MDEDATASTRQIAYRRPKRANLVTVKLFFLSPPAGIRSQEEAIDLLRIFEASPTRTISATRNPQ
jgi:hypothetical protein